jgi:hypothetical protein
MQHSREAQQVQQSTDTGFVNSRAGDASAGAIDSMANKDSWTLSIN